jgi:cellulose synthase/poly-beta-1,6-N-acetylglucosamine synthase-like glycosyltransferase
MLSQDTFCEADIGLWQLVNVLCITLYNETLQELEATIISAVGSLKQYHNISSSEGDVSAICIIVDGAATLHSEIRSAFIRWGFLTERADVDAEGTRTYMTLHDTDHLMARLRPGLLTLLSGTKSRITVLVVIKSINRGKLHSHKLFFSQFCPVLNPTYCYQIDAGTILDGELITLLAEHMRQQLDIGAVAPQITPAVPLPGDSFLAKWQFFDFAFRACIEWPFEMLTGYLSVLPGQVCAFRWHALRGGAPDPANAQISRSPIQTYLEGMEAATPTDRVRYLAEDRVIGTSLMFSARGAWRVRYIPHAVSTTDRCTSLMELLRQRRRWNNGALLTRYWLFLQIPRFMKRQDRTWAAKASMLRWVAGQLLIACRDFFGPAVLAALLMVLVWRAFTVWNTLDRLAYIAYFTAAGLDIALKTYSLTRGDQHAPPWLASSLTILDYTCPLLFVVVILSFTWPAALLLSVPALGLIPSALLLPRRSLGIMLRSVCSPCCA